MTSPRLPPGQQLAAPGKWPLVGERLPAPRPAVWTIAVEGHVSRPGCWTLQELRGLPQVEPIVDIHCVTRWSKLGARFRGVELAELLSRCEALPEARYISFTAHSERNHSTSLMLDDALQLGAFLAFEYEGEPLPVEHGGPVRMVTPGRYFYKSLKWLRRIELLAEDRLGYWEREAGYHNRADPWRQERYLAPALDRREAAQRIAARDFRGADLRSIDAADRDLEGLDARGALLRDANFRRSRLAGARFDGANLSNAHFEGADLRNAVFRNADLEGADFAGAVLRGADLRGASLFGATFTSRTEPPLVAMIDESTQFDAAGIEQLTPEQRRFLDESHNANRR
jgi:DMSO/TMAO reductase YedYZ molybdopterin-dependent catalytic subunit